MVYILSFLGEYVLSTNYVAGCLLAAGNRKMNNEISDFKELKQEM